MMTVASERPESTDSLPFRVVVLSGPSGSGKTTIVHHLLEQSSIPLIKAISATTRPPRKGEVHGEDYYFLTNDEFMTRRNRNEFVETAEVYGAGYWYGTLLSEIDRARKLNSWSFLEIDVEGALRVVQLYPDAITIFLKTPSPEIIEQRLRGRGTDSEETIQRRLKQAHHELAQAHKYRYQIVNDHLDAAVQRIIALLQNEAGICSKN